MTDRDRLIVACMLEEGDDLDHDPESHLGDEDLQDIPDWDEGAEIVPATWDAFTEE